MSRYLDIPIDFEPCIKSDFRTSEKLEKKFILNKLHLEFNEIYVYTYIS